MAGQQHFRAGSPSSAGRCFEPLGVARALDRDRGRGAFDLGEVVPLKLDIRRAEVLLEPVELCGTGDRHDPRLLPEEPRDRDLRGSRVLLFRDSAEQVDERLIDLHCLRCEARQSAAKVVAGELSVLVHRAGQEALAERAVRHEADAQLLRRWKANEQGIWPKSWRAGFIYLPSQTLCTEQVPWRFGGQRFYFVCECGRRVEKLHAFGDRPWRCRDCHNLTYAARQAVPRDRHLLMAQKIREQLGGSLSLLDAFPPRPKGMHRRRYERLRRRHDAATQQMMAAYRRQRLLRG